MIEYGGEWMGEYDGIHLQLLAHWLGYLLAPKYYILRYILTILLNTGDSLDKVMSLGFVLLHI
jgi:hypothetical protein